MLFNSYEFIFLFLPVTLVGFFLLGRGSRTLALGWLILASLFFYAWWRPINVPIIAPSIAVNFALARCWFGSGRRRQRPRRPVLLLGHRIQRLLPGLLQVRQLRLGTATT